MVRVHAAPQHELVAPALANGPEAHGPLVAPRPRALPEANELRDGPHAHLDDARAAEHGRVGAEGKRRGRAAGEPLRGVHGGSERGGRDLRGIHHALGLAPVAGHGFRERHVGVEGGQHAAEEGVVEAAGVLGPLLLKQRVHEAVHHMVEKKLLQQAAVRSKK